MVANARSLGVKNSARIVLCSRSTFPVVVGEYGAVSRCRMPLSAQIRSNITGPGPVPNRPVNTLPLNVSQDLARYPVAAQRLAQGLAHRPGHHLRRHDKPGMVIDPSDHLDLQASARCTRPITSICHSSIARPRSQRQ
jgi:hypothetical protein